MAKEALATRNPDGVHTDVLSSSRQACYKARDAFYACLEKESGKKQTEIGSKGLLYSAQCKPAREQFVSNCRGSWEDDQESVVMPNENGQDFICYMPKSGKPVLQQNTSDMIVETEKPVKMKTPDELVEVLKNKCFIRVNCPLNVYPRHELLPSQLS